MASNWRLAKLAFISLSISLGLLICSISVVGRYDEATHVPGTRVGYGEAFVVGLLGLIAFFVVYPVIALAVASFENSRKREVPRWKKHGCVLLALAIVLPLWVAYMAGSFDVMFDAMYEMRIIYPPLAIGWLAYSEAMDRLRKFPAVAIASAESTKPAVKTFDDTDEQMTPEQIAEAQRMAQKSKRTPQP